MNASSSFGRRCRQTGWSGQALGLLAVTSLLMLALTSSSALAQQQSATARTHDIAWGHPNPGEVSHFVLLVSPTASLGDARQVELGKPAGTPLAQLTVYSAMISFEPNEFVAVTAVGFNGRTSAPSPWTGMPASQPGQPLVVGY